MKRNLLAAIAVVVFVWAWLATTPLFMAIGALLIGYCAGRAESE